MSINIVIGGLGSGKTGWCTVQAIRGAARGRRQICNWVVYDPGIEYAESWAAMREQEEATLWIDEAYLWFSKMEWQTTSISDLAYYKQSRHRGVSLNLIAHKSNDIHSRIYDVANDVVYIRRLFGPTEDDQPGRVEELIGCWDIVWRYDACGWDTPTKRTLKGVSLWRLDSAFGLWERYQIVGGKDGRGAKIGSRPGRSRLIESVEEGKRTWLQLLRPVDSPIGGLTRYVIDEELADREVERQIERAIIEARGGV